ncbi:hypothetical protein HK103_006563 [Boothiomyces macroporosus]|uniref:Ankyrin repeat protein n=1 Tax=Boothiomyces macroporosus TaxID=261099 RepID=A0AAD5UGU7_9FUNG|nr:hypothetical protein HK103_006563 [Boothiomyces macroporosus]
MIYGAVIYGRMYSDTKWIFTQYLNTEFQIILEAAAATELYLQAVHEMNTTLIQTIFQSNIIQDISTHNQVFLKSCSFIDLDLLELFLDDERIDFNFRMGQNSVVSFAADNPRKEILERIMKEDGLEIRIGDLTLILELNIKHQHVLELLQHNRMQPFLNENNDMPIIVASRTGQYAAVKYLIGQESVNPAAQNNLAVIEAAATGNFDLVQLLVNDDRVNPYDQDSRIFTNCANSLRIFRYLRNDHRANVFLHRNEILTNAILKSNTELIDYIIDEKILTLEEFNSTHLLALAIRNYQELLKNVIEKSQLSISYSQNNVNYLEFLYRNGQHGPLKLLSPLLDQSFEGTSWLETQSILALTDENYQIFEMYLSNKYYNLSSFITTILKLLITQDKPELVAKVLDHKSFKPTKFIEVFKHLMRTDNLEIAKMLLKDKRIDPSHKGNAILKRACSKRKPEFVKLLLNHKKVDPSDNDYEAIRIAAQNGFEDVLDVFRNSKKVDPKVFDKINL